MQFCCLKAGTAYGPEYVNILESMIRENLRQDFTLHCITDNPEGLSETVSVIDLPKGLEKWWGKLWMFSTDCFPVGERITFMDLDTIIVGDIGFLDDYAGEFATLRDFYYPNRLGPAIIQWRSGGESLDIWLEWDASGRPRDRMGDLWWINQLDGGMFAKRADIIQSLYPDKIYSFKAHRCDKRPPESASIICFHGEPKPHNCTAHWVQEIWRT